MHTAPAGVDGGRVRSGSVVHANMHSEVEEEEKKKGRARRAQTRGPGAEKRALDCAWLPGGVACTVHTGEGVQLHGRWSRVRAARCGRRLAGSRLRRQTHGRLTAGIWEACSLERGLGRQIGCLAKQMTSLSELGGYGFYRATLVTSAPAIHEGALPSSPASPCLSRPHR